MVYLTRRASFSASHRLWNPRLSEAENQALYDKCANLHGHGHNYILEVTVQGKVDPETGMFVNLTALKRTMDEQIINQVDHRHLNYDVPWLKDCIPTTEILAIKCWERLTLALPDKMLYEVKLYETEHNAASYRGEGEA